MSNAKRNTNWRAPEIWEPILDATSKIGSTALARLDGIADIGATYKPNLGDKPSDTVRDLLHKLAPTMDANAFKTLVSDAVAALQAGRDGYYDTIKTAHDTSGIGTGPRGSVAQCRVALLRAAADPEKRKQVSDTGGVLAWRDAEVKRKAERDEHRDTIDGKVERFEAAHKTLRKTFPEGTDFGAFNIAAANYVAALRNLGGVVPVKPTPPAATANTKAESAAPFSIREYLDSLSPAERGPVLAGMLQTK